MFSILPNIDSLNHYISINLEVVDQSLTAIVGKVGSGKSAILSAILGDLHKVSGQVQVKVKICFPFP